MANNLRPASSINDLRTTAHMALSARLQAIDLTPLLIRTLGTNLPSSILPYLIWELDMMVPSVPMQALGVTSQTIIQNALPLHKIMGTPGAISQALSLCGFNATMYEGQASWGGSSYPANQGWAVFRVGVAGSGQSPIGVIDGTNRSFNLPAVPVGNSLRVFYNGLLQLPGVGYTTSGTGLEMSFTPALGSALCVLMRKSTDGTPLYFDAVVPMVSGSNLILPEAPISIELYRNGMFQSMGASPAQLEYMATIINFFKPARCLLDSVFAEGGKDYYILDGNTIIPSVPIGSASFLAWGTYAGTGTAPNFADWITPTGTLNGTNKIFTLPQAPSPAASLRLYRGWQVLKSGGVDYTLSGATITYTIAPPPTATHMAFYRY
jgi:hypothetical protein